MLQELKSALFIVRRLIISNGMIIVALRNGALVHTRRLPFRTESYES